MEKDLYDKLRAAGILAATIAVLEEEKVTNMEILIALGEEHFDKLLNKMNVGQHALVRRVWRSSLPKSPDFVKSPTPTSSSSEYSGFIQSPSSDAVLPEARKRKSVSSSPYTSYSKSPTPPLSCVSPGMDQQATYSGHEDIVSDVKRLAELYKSKKGTESCSKMTMNKAKDPRTWTITLGAMIFDPAVGKGIKKHTIGHPNPRKIEIPRKATMKQVIEKGLQTYFEKFDISPSETQLADSDGIMVELADRSCSLESYFARNDYKPSKHKLYIMISEKEPTVHDVFSDDEDNVDYDSIDLESGNVDKRKGTMIVSCIECGIEYCTYIPGKDCYLPDGTVFGCHQEPQDKCPYCEYNYVGVALNKDRFPDLC